MNTRKQYTAFSGKWGDRLLSLLLFGPMVTFGCLAVIEECTFDLIDEWRTA